MNRIILFGAFLFLFGCSDNGNKSDAYGNFEATEIIISAEATGRLLSFDVDEGTVLKAGGSGSYVRNGANAETRSRTLRRMSSRLCGLTSSLNGSFARSPRSRAMRMRRKKPPRTMPPVPS